MLVLGGHTFMGRPSSKAISPLHLPYTSPTSPLHLPYISPTSPRPMSRASRMLLKSPLDAKAPDGKPQIKIEP